ncbi:MAG: right-handed parallel beta-helix repeat-containing protein [Pseudomonadota bacterium]|nr:right-handed parallel beta-helix repeat-containing protein [Afipia sp.]
MSGFKPSLLLTRLVINQLTSVIGACCRIGFVLIAGTTVAYCKDVEIDVGPSSPASSHRAATDISQAIDIVRSDIAAGNKPGTYRINLAYPAITLDRSIVLEGLRAPEGTRIILSGIPRTGTRISSGFRAERFLKTADPGGSPYKYTLALSDFPADTSKRLIDTFATSSPQKIIIRANNNLPLHPTRWPAQGFAQIQNIGTPLIGRLASLPFGLGASENKAIVPGLWVAGYFTDPYFFVHARAEAADSAGRVWVERARMRADGKPPERLYLYNLRSFVTCDSFFYDPQNRSLNFCTNAPIEQLEIATADTLLNISSASGLRFENIIFELANGTAIDVRDSSNIDFQNNIVQLTGGDGISYTNTRDSTVSKATIRNVGGRAVWLSGGDRTTLTSSGLVLEDSFLSNFSLVERTYAPAIQADGVGVRVRRNVIFNGPQSAVMYSGNDHLFENNVMGQLLTEAGDSGFFYTGRDFTSQGSVIRRNILLGTGERYFNDARGIYLDEFSSGNTVIQNIIVGIPYGIVLNGGKDNRLASNIFVMSNPSIWASALGYQPWWQIWKNDHMSVPNGLSVRELYRLPIGSEPWSSRYPELTRYRDSDLLKPERNIIERNTFLGGGSITATDGKLETAAIRQNIAVVYSGSLQLLESLRNKTKLKDLGGMLTLVAKEIERHGIRSIPMRIDDQVGASLASGSISESP